MTDDLDDAIEFSHRLAQSGQAPQQAHPRRRTKEPFIIVPMRWKDRLQAARHAASLKLAHHLLYLAWKRGEHSIRLTNAAAEAAGVK